MGQFFLHIPCPLIKVGYEYGFTSNLFLSTAVNLHLGLEGVDEIFHHNSNLNHLLNKNIRFYEILRYLDVFD